MKIVLFVAIIVAMIAIAFVDAGEGFTIITNSSAEAFTVWIVTSTLLILTALVVVGAAFLFLPGASRD